MCWKALLLFALIATSAIAEAHPGGLDVAGCHRDTHREMIRHCHAAKSGKPTPPSASRPFSNVQTIGPASVIDGDTLEIRGVRIRLHGIDAPESRQSCVDPRGRPWRCGQQAALKLYEKIGRSSVSCVGRNSDRYGRLVAICSIGDQNLNQWMVSQGWAVAYRKYSLDYAPEEAEAKSLRRNIWSGQFDLPWNWRAAQRGR